jgi:hypothetical protein
MGPVRYRGGGGVARFGVVVCVAVLCSVGLEAGTASAGARGLVSATWRAMYPTDPAAIVPVAALTANGPGGRVGFDETALSGQTLAAHGFDLQNLNVPVGVYAFNKPAAGWSSAATPGYLTAAGGDRLGGLAASGGMVVAGDASLGDAGPVTAFVFTRPSGGWAGNENESARLVATTNGSGEFEPPLVAIAGNAVLSTDGSSVSVFDQPVGGWSGTITPSATLTGSPGLIRSLAAQGNTAIIRTEQSVLIYRRPSGGWSGTIAPSATLTLPGPEPINPTIAYSGGAIVTDGPLSVSQSVDHVFVIRRPATGWSTQRHPKLATLTILDPDAYLPGPMLGISGSTVVMSTALTEEEHECPCLETFYAASTPAAWSGMTSLRSAGSLQDVSGADFALVGQTLASGSAGGVQVSTVSRPSHVSSLRLTALRSARPSLSMSFAFPGHGTRGDGVTLRLPSALRLQSGLVRRIRITGARHGHIRILGNTVTASLSAPIKAFGVTIANGALTESPGLAAQVAKLFRSGHPGRSTVGLGLTAQLRGPDRGVTSARITIALS